MTNGQTAATFLVALPDTDTSASGTWSESYVKRPETQWRLGRIGQIAGLVLALSTTPATAIADPWFQGRQRRDTATATWISDSVVGRRVTRAEALRLARQIMERAERERARFAEWEAARGIQWEQVE